MESINTPFGPWQSNARTLFLVPTAAASYAATGMSGAGVARADAPAAGTAAKRTHKSITRPGSPPRGRHR